MDHWKHLGPLEKASQPSKSFLVFKDIWGLEKVSWGGLRVLLERFRHLDALSGPLRAHREASWGLPAKKPDSCNVLLLIRILILILILIPMLKIILIIV